MFKFTLPLCLFLLSTSGAAQCGSASLTTLFAANNGGSNGWGVFFDVSVASPTGINVCGLETNTGTTVVGVAFTIDVYVTPASYVSVHGVPSAWRLMGTASGIAAGNNVPSYAALVQPILLPTGSYGIALYHNGVTSVRYTNGTGTNQVYSNADLTITTGLVRSTLFGTPAAGSIFTPRVWNGTIYYETCSLASGAGFGFLAAGCAGSLPVTRIQAASLPQLGGVLLVNLTNLPTSSADLFVGLSNTNSIFGPLPIDLTPFGAAGCLAHVSPDLLFSLSGTGNTASFSVGIPSDPVLQCVQFYMQAVVYDPGVNPLGFVLSDAIAAIVGI